MSTFYVTTPIYYPNDKLHIGHSYTSVAADSIARYKKMRGFDVRLLTGTDEHGLKIERRAAELKMPVMEYLDGIIAWIKDLWVILDVEYDVFIRTTDKAHVSAVQKIFRRLYEQGDIYKSEYEGLYCVPDETFYTESQAKDGKCPMCGRGLERSKEESYFFRLSKYQAQLEEHIEKNPDFILPVSRKNEMVQNFLKPGLEDLCVSRTSFKWGVPVDFDPGHIVYVWIDALSNYITALGYESDDDSEYKKYWPADVHLVAKEIVRFHTIIWPIMLIALGEPLPKTVFGHGWLLFGDTKMSKSLGNVVDPKLLAARYGADAVRYFLMRDVAFGQDGNFTNELLLRRINADLANDLGNLLSRTVAMTEKYFGGGLPSERQDSELTLAIRDKAAIAVATYERSMDSYLFNEALDGLFALIGSANKLIDLTKPWELGRDVEKNSAELAGVLYTLTEVLRFAAIMLSPVMPKTPEKIFEQIGVSSPELKVWDSLKFGLLPDSTKVSKGAALFPRFDVAKELEQLADQMKTDEPAEKPEEIEYIDIGQFARTKLKVGIVLECERVKKSDRLLVSKIKVGDEVRTIVSGIAKWRAPEDMVGKRVIVVTNLKPVKIKGIMSEGMILAASKGDELCLLTVDADIDDGSDVS